MSPSCGMEATPRLMVTWVQSPVASSNSLFRTASHILIAVLTASSLFVFVRITDISSPPYLQGISVDLIFLLMVCATCLKTASPDWCPYVSLNFLKKSMSTIIKENTLSYLFEALMFALICSWKYLWLNISVRPSVTASLYVCS